MEIAEIIDAAKRPRYVGPNSFSSPLPPLFALSLRMERVSPPPLPHFRLHSDPLSSGSLEWRPVSCRACEQERPATYVGPVVAAADLEDALCPWCIADGTAHARFGVEFFDAELVPSSVSSDVLEELLTRTPGFHTWQGIEWPLCCGAPSSFLEPVGAEQLRARYREVEGPLIGHMVHDLGMSGGALHALIAALDRDRGPTAYVFRCLACSTLIARIDRP